MSCAAIVDEEGAVTFDYTLGKDWIIIQRVYPDAEYIKTIETETKAFLDDLEKLVRKMK